MQIEIGQMHKEGHFDVEMKGWIVKAGHYNEQIKRVDG